MARAVKLDPRRNSGTADPSRRGASPLGVRAEEDGLRAWLRARGFPARGLRLGGRSAADRMAPPQALNLGKAEAPA